MFKNRFKTRTSTFVLLFLLVVSNAGCVYIVVGSLGALGGYVVSPDTVEGVITGREYAEVWEATVEVLSVMGIIEDKNSAAGTVNANIHRAKVAVTVLRTPGDVIRLNVKARKTLLPKIKVAQDVYIKIVNHLDQAYSTSSTF